jgi:hypothetical protein
LAQLLLLIAAIAAAAFRISIRKGLAINRLLLTSVILVVSLSAIKEVEAQPNVTITSPANNGFNIPKNTQFNFGGDVDPGISEVTVTYWYFPAGVPDDPVSRDITVYMHEWHDVREFPTAGALYVSVIPKTPSYGYGEYKGGNVVD